MLSDKVTSSPRVAAAEETLSVTASAACMLKNMHKDKTTLNKI